MRGTISDGCGMRQFGRYYRGRKEVAVVQNSKLQGHRSQARNTHPRSKTGPPNHSTSHHQAQSTHPRTKTGPPTHSTSHPPTHRRAHAPTHPPCVTVVLQYVQQRNEALVNTSAAEARTLRKDNPVRCCCAAVWYIPVGNYEMCKEERDVVEEEARTIDE